MPNHYILKNNGGEYWTSRGWDEDDEEAVYYSQSQKDTMKIPSDASWIEADDDDDESDF